MDNNTAGVFSIAIVAIAICFFSWIFLDFGGIIAANQVGTDCVSQQDWDITTNIELAKSICELKKGDFTKSIQFRRDNIDFYNVRCEYQTCR